MLQRTKKQRCAGRLRRGNAAIELAVILPLISLIIFGSVEVCSQIHTKQAIESAAYECARVAISAGATNEDIEAKMNQILSARNITGGELKMVPSDIEDVERGERIRIKLSAPSSSNSMALTSFVKTGDIKAECVMVKEL